MKTKHNSTRTKGIALLTGLVLLLLMSLLAIAGLKDALLETRIARNYMETELLFQQTESALRYAESSLLPNSSPHSLIAASEGSQHHPVHYNSLASSPATRNLFEPSTVDIYRLTVPGSRVRGNGPQNEHAGLEFFRIRAITRRTDSEQGVQIVSTVSRGTH